MARELQKDKTFFSSIITECEPNGLGHLRVRAVLLKVRLSIASSRGVEHDAAGPQRRTKFDFDVGGCVEPEEPAAQPAKPHVFDAMGGGITVVTPPCRRTEIQGPSKTVKRSLSSDQTLDADSFCRLGACFPSLSPFLSGLKR